jgi:glycerol transport system permease protein
VKIFMPLIASGHRRRGVLLLHVLLGGTAARRTLTAVDAKPIAATMTRTQGASGIDWGVLAAAGVLTIIPGAFVIYFVRNYIAKGFALGPGVMTQTGTRRSLGRRRASRRPGQLHG